MRDESQMYDAYDVGEGARASRWSTVLGAVVSLAVLGGVVTWAYKLGVRDAHEVPVVRAVEGPMRVRPEDPGGAQVAHQGRAVYDAVSGRPAPIQTIALAPPPERLAAEDTPVAATEVQQSAASPGLRAAIADEVDQLVAAVLGGGATGEAGDPPVAASALEPSSAEAPTRSPAPPPRPTAGATVVAAIAPAIPPAAAPASAPPAAAAPAGVQVQLGAYLSADDAERVWRGFRSRNGDLLAGRAPDVAPLVGANRTLYLLRAGPFADVAEARALCGALRARGEECILAGTP